MSSKISKQGTAPELRFSGFKEPWENLTMRDISSINQGLQIPIDQRLTEKIDGSYFYITNEFLKKGSKRSYYIVDPSPSVSCVETDILMTRTGNTGMVVTGVVGAFHNNFFKISYKESIARFFLYYFLTSHPTQHTLLKLAGTSTIPDLNHGDFYRIAIAVPTLPEQRKIADFLTAVDGRIRQLIQKKALLEDYKKGVMQQLFSQAIRFKNDHGNEFPDWEEKKLGEVVKQFSSGATPFRGKPEYYNGDIKWISSGELNYNTIYDTKEHISERAKNDTNLKTHPPGTFLMAITGLEAAGTRGSCAITGVSATTNQSCMAIYPSEGLNTDFLFQWYKHHGEQLAFRYCQGTKQQSYTAGLLRIVPISKPRVLTEQQKIADFLSAIDCKIKNVATQVTETQTFKKGLLQQMFV